MSNEQFVEKFEELYRKYNPNKMEDEKQQPTPEQIVQWKKEARIHAGSNYKKNHFPKSWTDSYEGYFAGRQAAFDEYSKIIAEVEIQLTKASQHLKLYEQRQRH